MGEQRGARKRVGRGEGQVSGPPAEDVCRVGGEGWWWWECLTPRRASEGRVVGEDVSSNKAEGTNAACLVDGAVHC